MGVRRKRLFRIYGIFIGPASYRAIGRARQNLFLQQSSEFAGHGRQSPDIQSFISLELEHIATSLATSLCQFVDLIALQVNRNESVHIEPAADEM